MTKTICIVTATRAEWGLLRPLANEIQEDDAFSLLLAVTGTHFSEEFGNTWKEIVSDGFSIDERVDIITSPIQNAVDVSNTMARALTGFSGVFSRHKIDLVILLGDRYETLAVALAAMNARVPIMHLYGGDVTEGALDDAIRHSISKLSYLHCTSCETYRKRVIQLGEEPNRVYNVGAIGIDNVRKMSLLSKKELSEELGFAIAETDYAVVTFHPETLNNSNVKEQCQQFLDALSAFPDMKYIITKSNADEGADIINRMMEEYAASNPNAFVVSSLGNLRYLSALKSASLVIGNSSSGIMESPYFRVPTINLGIRQRGRIQSECIINCEISTAEIIQAMQKALSPEFREFAKTADYPYGDGHAAEKILAVLHEWLDIDRIDLKKKFYDMEAE